MVFIFIFMVLLMLADFLSDRVLAVLRKALEPRAPIVRARRYRFN